MTPKQFEAVCQSIETQTIGLSPICQALSVDKTSFWKYIAKTEGANDRYARAKQIQAEILASEILSIADTPQKGVKTIENEKGIETITGDMIEHRRLRVDSRKWLLSKLLPKKYGDRLDLTSGGEAIKTTPPAIIVSNDQTKQILDNLYNGDAKKPDH